MSTKFKLVVALLLLDILGLTARAAPQDAAIVDFLAALQDSSSSDLVPSRQGGDSTTVFSSALAVMAFLTHGEVERARLILEAFEAFPMGDPCPNPNARGLIPLCACQGGLQQFRDLETGAPVDGDNDFWVGDNAWLLMAARRYQEITRDTQFQPLIEHLTAWLVCVEDLSRDVGTLSGFRADGTLINDDPSALHPEGNISVHGSLRGIKDPDAQTARSSIRDWIDQAVWPPMGDCFAIPDTQTNLALDHVSWGYPSLGPSHECLIDHANARLRRTPNPYDLEVFDRNLTNPEHADRWQTDQSDPGVAIDISRLRVGADHLLEVSYSLEPDAWFRVFRDEDVDLSVTSGFRYGFWMRGNSSGNRLEIKLRDRNEGEFWTFMPLASSDWQLIEVPYEDFGPFVPPGGGPLGEINRLEFAVNNTTMSTTVDTLRFATLWYFDEDAPLIFPADGFAAFESDQNYLWLEGSGHMAAAYCKAGRLEEWAHYQAEAVRHLVAPTMPLTGLGLPNSLTGSDNNPIPELEASVWHLLASSCLDVFDPGGGDRDGDLIGEPIDLCLVDDATGDADGDGVCADLDCDDADPTVSSPPDCTPPPAGIVRRDGDRLLRDGAPFTIRGVNYFPKDYAWKFWDNYLMPGVIDQVEEELDLIRDLGINTVRVFLELGDFDGTDRNAPLNLEHFLGLLEDRGLLAILTLFDFSEPYFPEQDALSLTHLDEVVSPLAGNPTILAWDVRNEIDCTYDNNGISLVQKWLINMVREIRARDPNHLITVGFLGVRTGETLCSVPPGTGPPVFAPEVVADLTSLLDLVSFHYFLPETDYEADLEALRQQVEAMGDKPILIGEFGLYTLSEPDMPCLGGTSCIIPHTEAEQAAYMNAILALSEAAGLAGTAFWTLTDFSMIEPGFPDFEHCFGILRNTGADICERQTARDYTPKPAAHVVARHYGPADVRYLDLCNGLVDANRDEPPAGWREENGILLRHHNPADPDRLHWAHQAGRIAFSNAQPAMTGKGISPVLREVDIGRFPFLILRISDYSVQDGSDNDADLKISVREGDGTLTSIETLPAGSPMPIERRYDLGSFDLSGTLDLELLFELEPVMGSDGFSATWEFDCVAVIGSPDLNPCYSVPLFADGFESGTTLRWSTTVPP